MDTNDDLQRISFAVNNVSHAWRRDDIEQMQSSLPQLFAICRYDYGLPAFVYRALSGIGQNQRKVVLFGYDGGAAKYEVVNYTSDNSCISYWKQVVYSLDALILRAVLAMVRIVGLSYKSYVRVVLRF